MISSDKRFGTPMFKAAGHRARLNYNFWKSESASDFGRSQNASTPVQLESNGKANGHAKPDTAGEVYYEIIRPEELAKRFGVKTSWIYDQCRARAVDQLPHLALGKYRRFQWLCPELARWIERRKRGAK
jgi:predicted DNA-binding transcriptional regulator AlpA